MADADLLGRAGKADDVFVFETPIGLLLSNGPGTISAQGARGDHMNRGRNMDTRTAASRCQFVA